ncbi:GntR family transcriptional regulator [Nonomuraea sp. MCN248]|uniref:GntR family transcriptional regulator n=1 Tax=Nonomuraea corallina TaxID=2989783 RepID=A0ABT4SA86_9ACTN|nr:GntR family transcriptional regulator [Nonomuraea corallina]MDA0633851.1 GntR family transcriptional regulator [Nonomuraea corallina]
MADLIEARIRSGGLREGDPVPSEAALETGFTIARTTARRVARELRDRGLAYTLQGEGTFVGPPCVPRQRRTVPLYHIIAADLAERIGEGAFRPNRPIPSEKWLMNNYGVAKATARAAVAHLRKQGWVFTVPYRGTYVSSEERWPTTRNDRQTTVVESSTSQPSARQ